RVRLRQSGVEPPHSQTAAFRCKHLITKIVVGSLHKKPHAPQTACGTPATWQHQRQQTTAKAADSQKARFCATKARAGARFFRRMPWHLPRGGKSTTKAGGIKPPL